MAFKANETSITFVQDQLNGVPFTLQSWKGEEGYHSISSHVVTIFSKIGNLNLDDFFLKPASIQIQAHQDKKTLQQRIIRGIICKASVYASEADQFLYTFHIVPRLWRLSQNINTRIFQEKSSKEIIKEVIDEYGLPVELKLKTPPRKREYCVQFQESDLDFILRLAEDDGFYLFFNQAEDKVIFIDDPENIADTTPMKDYAWDPGEGLEQQLPETIQSVDTMQQPRWKGVLVKDYNYRTPDADLIKQAAGVNGEGIAYFYLAGHTNAGEGERLSLLRLQEHRAAMQITTFTSTIRSVAVGYRFTMIDFPANAYNISYQIIRAEHSYSGNTYKNIFYCIPLKTPYRPARITPCPKIYGLQTATVVGPSGFAAKGNSAEDLYVDSMGRIKVLFHWDLDTTRNENSSCWVRLMREYAGPNYGIYFLPRIGNEVLVSFIEGNPDYPIVVGSVHHADNVPPINEPANKTQNTLLMPSTNELRFEDKEGQELIYMHAQKDHSRVVENNESISVGNDRSKSIGHDETTMVGRNRTETVGNDETITIQNDRTETVVANEKITIGVNRDELVGSNEKIVIGVNRTTQIGNSETLDIGGMLETKVGNVEQRKVKLARTTEVGLVDSLTVGGARTTTVIGANTRDVGMYEAITVLGHKSEKVGKGKSITIATGNHKLEVVSGHDIIEVNGNQSTTVARTVTLKANEVIIKVGGSKVVITPSGVKVKASTIKLN